MSSPRRPSWQPDVVTHVDTLMSKKDHASCFGARLVWVDARLMVRRLETQDLACRLFTHFAGCRISFVVERVPRCIESEVWVTRIAKTQ